MVIFVCEPFIFFLGVQLCLKFVGKEAISHPVAQYLVNSNVYLISNSESETTGIQESKNFGVNRDEYHCEPWGTTSTCCLSCLNQWLVVGLCWWLTILGIKYERFYSTMRYEKNKLKEST